MSQLPGFVYIVNYFSTSLFMELQKNVKPTSYKNIMKFSNIVVQHKDKSHWSILQKWVFHAILTSNYQVVPQFVTTNPIKG